ncbi:TolC family protein [Oscillatoria sp. CS-180]|uniref:TolC family protein n=1 Tax=Oscillatoria sp. CS-180 TaxID=3021720 RepID=UPI00232DE459|nr:TolC family protein [Oscillatoria sp. CS-180]MDB9528284.1 TolC family protein [Oscillatoria sp. CS-180]
MSAREHWSKLGEQSINQHRYWWGGVSAVLLLALPLARTGIANSIEGPVFEPLPSETGSPAEGSTYPDTLTDEEQQGSDVDEALELEETVSPLDAVTTDGRSRVAVTLPELLNLVIVGNRDLRDRQLQRLIEQQQLQAAEERFDPQLTPTVGIGLNQRFEEVFGGGARLPNTIGGTSTDLGDRTTLTQSAGASALLLTRQGTEIDLTLDALSNTPSVRLNLTQPLLRGAGTAVNEAPVDIARLQESQNFLELQQTLTTTVSTTVTQYTNLIEAQESVRIQRQALDRRQRQLTILRALVEAGRRAEFDLVDSQRSVADAERDLLLAQNQLEEANTALLDQIGVNRDLVFVASPETITELFTVAIARVEDYDLETLVAIAYQTRPDYLQTELAQDIAQLNLKLAEDGLRWRLDIEGSASLGDFSETTIGLVARRTFDEPNLETDLVQRQVEIVQQDNRLAQQQTTIRNEITNQLNTVNANLARVEAAQRATENARLQLDVTRELFLRGRIRDIFQITTQEENLVDAENSELSARIQFLDSIVALDEAVGLTLETWSNAVDFLPVLLTPDALDTFEIQEPDLTPLDE